jgi:hypothetical protein
LDHHQNSAIAREILQIAVGGAGIPGRRGGGGGGSFVVGPGNTPLVIAGGGGGGAFNGAGIDVNGGDALTGRNGGGSAAGKAAMAVAATQLVGVVGVAGFSARVKAINPKAGAEMLSQV